MQNTDHTEPNCCKNCVQIHRRPFDKEISAETPRLWGYYAGHNTRLLCPCHYDPPFFNAHHLHIYTFVFFLFFFYPGGFLGSLAAIHQDAPANTVPYRACSAVPLSTKFPPTPMFHYTRTRVYPLPTKLRSFLKISFNGFHSAAICPKIYVSVSSYTDSDLWKSNEAQKQKRVLIRRKSLFKFIFRMKWSSIGNCFSNFG